MHWTGPAPRRSSASFRRRTDDRVDRRGAQPLPKFFADTSQKAASDIVARVGEIDNGFKAVGENLLSRLGERGNNLIERIQTSQNTVIEAINAHGDRVATRLTDAAEFARSAVGAQPTM